MSISWCCGRARRQRSTRYSGSSDGRANRLRRVAVTQAEAAARAALLTVGHYKIFLDLVARQDTVLCRTEITFSCNTPGASTFADLAMPIVTSATLNGERLDAAKAVGNDRLRLDRLAAQNALIVDAEFGYSPTGDGLSRFTDPA